MTELDIVPGGPVIGEYDEEDIRNVAASEENALNFTKHLMGCLEDFVVGVAIAYKARIWQALGLASWEEYCEKHLNMDVLKGSRQAVSVALRRSGMSYPTIGAALGVAASTVRNDIADAAVGHAQKLRVSPEVEDAEVVDISDTLGRKKTANPVAAAPAAKAAAEKKAAKKAAAPAKKAAAPRKKKLSEDDDDWEPQEDPERVLIQGMSVLWMTFQAEFTSDINKAKKIDRTPQRREMFGRWAREIHELAAALAALQ